MADAKWWDKPEGELHEALSAVVRHIHQRSSWRRQADELHAELYAGGPGAAGLNLQSRINYDYEPSSLPYNVCRSATDTVVAKIAKHRPLPQVLTTRGNWIQSKRARKCTQFLEGEFYRCRIFEKWTKLIVRDACVFGPGVLKVCVDKDERAVSVERTNRDELLVDEWDARYGDPRNLYQVRTIDKGVLYERYKGDDEKENERLMLALDAAGSDAATDGLDWFNRSDSTVDRVCLVEAWHLPSHSKADDGRHGLSLLGGSWTFVDEKWKRTSFPFAILNFSDPLYGFWGQGLVEQTEGFQYEINEMSEKVSEGHHMLGGGMILTPVGSDIVDTSFHNGVVPIIKHQPGKPPQFVTPAPIHPAAYQRLRDLVGDAFANAGVSQMSAEGNKSTASAGMSGVAIQAMDDQDTERFIIFGRTFEAWVLDIGRLMLDAAKDIAAEFGDYAVSVPMKGGLIDLSWADVNVDTYELRVFSTSTLPSQPGARFDRINVLFNSGVIDRATFLRLMDAPDLSAEMDMETADRLNIDERLELMLDAEGKELGTVYKMPSPYTGCVLGKDGAPSWALQRTMQKIAKAECDGAPEENLELLRRFATDIISLNERMAPKPAPMPMPGPGALPALDAMQPVAPPPLPPGQMPLGGAPPPPMQ